MKHETCNMRNVMLATVLLAGCGTARAANSDNTTPEPTTATSGIPQISNNRLPVFNTPGGCVAYQAWRDGTPAPGAEHYVFMFEDGGVYNLTPASCSTFGTDLPPCTVPTFDQCIAPATNP